MEPLNTSNLKSKGGEAELDEGSDVCVCVCWRDGAGPAALAALSLPHIVSLQPITQPPTSRLQTPCTNHSKFITQYPVPHHSTTRSPHLPSPPGPKGTPETEETEVNPDPCSSSGRRGAGPRSPFPQVPEGRRAEPSVPREQGPRLQQQRQHAGRSRGRCLRGRRRWGGRALPEESRSLVIPGCTRELLGSRGRPLVG